MSKRGLTISLMLIPLLVLVAATLPAQGKGPASEPAQQTWPSRTPTPEGGATNTPAPGATDPPLPGGGDSTATPVPTGEGQPDVTATTVVTVIASTPIGGFLPTAEPCSMSPTVQTRGLVNVREGPGLDYPTIDQLVYLEVRSIIGRAAAAPWWLIQLGGGDSGWVADQAVTVQGFTGAVPLVEPPPIGGNTPTPGVPWNPTPNPICTPEPTTTPTVTPMPTQTSIAQPAALVASPTPAPLSDTPVPATTATEGPASATATATQEIPATPLPTAAPLTASSNGGGAGSLMLYGGIGLLVVGLAAAALRLRGRPAENS